MDEKEKALRRFAEWEKYALEDEQIITLALREDGPPNQICLHSQQMAEKYLKGFLAFCKHIPQKTHQMEQLIKGCEEYDMTFEELKEDAIRLDGFYIEARYPGDMIDFTVQDARDGYESAKRIKEFVISRISNRQGFSMIEFLIALAIVSILSAAILVGLNSSKMQARDDAAMLAANETVDRVLECMDRNTDTNVNANTNDPICTGGRNKAELPNGWAYEIVNGSATNKTYKVTVKFAEDEERIIVCTNTTVASGRCTAH